jgi:hypothetical protein
MKGLLLGECTIRLLTECIKAARTKPRGLHVGAHLVSDTEIQGDEAVSTYAELWRYFAATNDAMRDRGISFEILSTEFAPEQERPALLVPDYLAGAFATVFRGSAGSRGPSLTEAEDFVARIRRCRKNFELWKGFDERYPPQVMELVP